MCVDPGIFARGGGRVKVHLTKKKADNAFLSFFKSSTYLQKSNGYFQIKLSYPRFQMGFNVFQGRGGGGRRLLIPCIETHIACDFPGGGGGLDPLSPSGSAHGESLLAPMSISLFKTFYIIHVNKYATHMITVFNLR